MNKLVKRLDLLLAAIAGLGIFFMTLLALANALSRTFFQAPIYGANEMVSTWFLPALVLLGIPSAQIWKEHINVTLAIESLGPRSLAWLRLIGYTLSGVLSLAFAFYGFDKAMEQMAIKATSGVTSLPVWPAYFLVPFGFLLASVVLFLDAWIGFKKPEHEINTATGKPITELDG